MNNTGKIIVLILIIVVGVVVFAKTRTESPATVEDTDMGDMENMAPVNAPSGYNSPVNAPADAPVKEFVVDGKNFSFAPNQIKVQKGDVVKIVFKNSQGFHDLVIDEYRVATKQIRTGEEETITFLADKAGSFEYYCSVGTHRAMGMTGTLTVE